MTESVLNALRKGEMQISPPITDLLLESLDIVRLLISQIKETGQESAPENLAKVLEELKKYQPGEGQKKEEKPAEAKKEEKPASAEPPAPSVQPAPGPAAAAPAEQKAPAEVKAEEKPQKKDVVIPEEDKKLGQLLVQEGLVSEDELEEALGDQDQGPKLGEILVQKGIISREQLDAVLQKQKQKADRLEQTIRVEVSRLDSLMNLVGELVLGRNRLAQVCRKIEGSCTDDRSLDDLNETIAQLGMISGDLQESIMKTRMLPIQRVIGKFPRLIRSLQKSTKKEFDLKISGEDTELDKSIIEEIGDPLVHLVRNAADHGIEAPDKRIAAGKAPRGTVQLRAFHEGNNIIIEVKDDGRGMDIEKIREKAVKKNLVTRQKADLMTKEEVLNFIFFPGFSTADIVTEISGRGVGLDVVRQNITKLKGIIEIETELNAGSTIRIKLPLTLAIIQALIVGIGRDIFAIPLSSVVETVRVRPDEIFSVEGRRIINLRGTIIPLVDLTEVFGADSAADEPPGEKGLIYIVIVGVAERRKGLVVGRLLGQEEIVIKSLGKYLKGIHGFSGCTIMGDGKITLIMDIESFFEEATGAASAPGAEPAGRALLT
jgi:two-component system chemotaxis sensor kinase CheA